MHSHIDQRTPIDIIIVCYNYGRFLPGAIESALSQTYQPKIITVIDDASTDDTPKIVQRYDGVQYIRNPQNLGLIKTMQRAVSATAAPLFTILSADDELREDFLEKLSAALHHNPDAAFAYSQIQHIGLRTDINPVGPFSPSRLIFEGNYISGCCLMRREAYQRVGGFQDNMESGQEDWDLWLSMVEAGLYGFFVPEPLFRYRIHANSRNWRYSINVADAQRNIRLIRRNHPRLFNWRFRLLYPPYLIWLLVRRHQIRLALKDLLSRLLNKLRGTIR